MTAPYIVIEFPDGQRAAQQVRLGTTLQDLEDLWDGAWQDFSRPNGERIRVGLGHGFLLMRQECDSDAVSKLKTEWLGYRDAVLPPPDDEAKGDDAEHSSADNSAADDKAEVNPDTFMSEFMLDKAKKIHAAHVEAEKLDDSANRAKSRARSTGSEAKQARVRIGKMLLDVRREHGGPERGPGAKWWGNFVMRTGIPQRTARKYMAEAERAEVSARGRNPEAHIPPNEQFRAAVRKLTAKWLIKDIPALLRDVAAELEQQAEAEGGGQ